MNFYEELGIAPDATEQEIRKAHRRLVKVMHPDAQPDPRLKQLAENQMRRLNSIVSTLLDHERRREYDDHLHAASVAQSKPAGFPGWSGVPWWMASAIGAVFFTLAVVWLWADHTGKSRAAYNHVTVAENSRSIVPPQRKPQALNPPVTPTYPVVAPDIAPRVSPANPAPATNPVVPEKTPPPPMVVAAKPQSSPLPAPATKLPPTEEKKQPAAVVAQAHPPMLPPPVVTAKPQPPVTPPATKLPQTAEKKPATVVAQSRPPVLPPSVVAPTKNPATVAKVESAPKQTAQRAATPLPPMAKLAVNKPPVAVPTPIKPKPDLAQSSPKPPPSVGPSVVAQAPKKLFNLPNGSVTARVVPNKNVPTSLPAPPSVATVVSANSSVVTATTALPTPAPPRPAPIVIATSASPASAMPRDPLEGEWVYAPTEPEKPRAGFYPPEFIDLKLFGAGDAGALKGQYSAKYLVTDRPVSPEVSFQVASASKGSRRFVWQASNGMHGTMSIDPVDDRTIRIDWRTTSAVRGPTLTSGTATLVRRQ